ncbi:MAG: electron transfer flavoprotein subunit beta [Phycisphaerae bacterium]|nr:MAG: electron transfer flavoprotein subunit beta [Phycisphaerae bacterium]
MKILVVAEMQLGNLKPSNRATIRMAQDLAAQNSGTFSMVLIGHQLADATNELNQYGAKKLFVIDATTFEHYLADSLADAICKLVKEHGFDRVLGGEATTARDFFPRLAGALDAGMCRGVCGLTQIDGATCYQRPVFSGMALRTERIHTPIHVITVDPTAMDEPNAGDAGEVVAFDAGVSAGENVKFVELQRAASERPDLSVADRVIGAGRGIKSADYLDTIGKLADKLGAAVGATRAVVDAGWLPNEFQVGQTGKAIAPKLYIAIGISGAVQHAAGIRGAKTIVAINKDAEAPIFKIADVGLVADLFDAVPQLIENL